MMVRLVTSRLMWNGSAEKRNSDGQSHSSLISAMMVRIEYRIGPSFSPHCRPHRRSQFRIKFIMWLRLVIMFYWAEHLIGLSPFVRRPQGSTFLI